MFGDGRVSASGGFQHQESECLKKLPNALDDVIEARDWHAREVAQLEAARKRIVEIRSLKLLARELRVVGLDDAARYWKTKLSGIMANIRSSLNATTDRPPLLPRQQMTSPANRDQSR